MSTAPSPASPKPVSTGPGDPGTAPRSRAWRAAARVAGVYLLVSIAWILLSDLALTWSEYEPNAIAVVQTIKGLFFVALSSVVIFGIVLTELRSMWNAQDLLRAVVEGTSDAVFVKDQQGRYLLFNAAAGKLVGKLPADVLGHDDTAIFEPESSRRIMARDREVLAAGRPLTQEEELTAAGVTRTFLATKSPLRDIDGRIIGIIGISRDITERKQMELALHESDGRSRAVLNSMMALIAVIDRQGTIVTVNDSWQQFVAEHSDIRGPAPQADVGANFLAICVACGAKGCDDALQVAVGVRKVLDRNVANFVYEYACAVNGRPMWFQFRATPLQSGVDGAVTTHTNITERKLAEQALRDRERLFRCVFDQQFQYMAVLSPDGTVREVNDLPLKVSGYAREDYIGAPFWDTPGWRAFPDRQQTWQSRLQRAAASNEPILFEDKFQARDGSIGYGDTSITAIRDATGNVEFFVVQASDTTARKYAELALVGQKRVLERIADGASLSEVLEEIVVLVEEQLPGAYCSILLLDHEHQRLKFGAGRSLPADYNAAIDGVAIGPAVGSCGTAAYIGQTVVVADIATDPRWANYDTLALSHGLRSCWSVPILTQEVADLPAGHTNAQVLGTFALYRGEPSTPTSREFDVVAGAARLAGIAIEREAAERAIRESEERYRRLVDMLPSAVFISAHKRVVFCNRALLQMAGATREDQLLGKDPFSLFHPDFHPALHRQFDTMRETTQAVPGSEASMVRLDGRTVPVHMATPITDRGQPSILVALHDLTERDRLEQQLRQAQKMEAIGQLAGGIAHDFNNILTIINGFSEVLLPTLAPDDVRHGQLAAIKHAGERAAGLTRQLLAFSRKAVIAPRVLDLNIVVESVGMMLRRLIGEDIDFTTRLGPGLPSVRIDAGQLEQVLMNLVVNSRDAMPRGGRVTVETSEVDLCQVPDRLFPDAPAGKYVRLVVADTGEGMSEEVKAHVFEPFFTTKEIGKGTGLGLATVYGIVQQAGGYIAVESRPRVGSTFTILFPAVDEAATTAPPNTSLAPRGAETILLVEDEDQVRTFARLVLEMHGYTVLAANSGPEALRFIDEHDGPIHLMLTDVVMPGMGGRDLVDAVRGRRPSIRVIYASGYTDDAIVRHGVDDAASAFLQKPFTPRELAEKVRTMLDQ